MKNARKLVAAAMALAMTAALAPVNAFAVTIEQNTESKTGALVAKLTVQPSYTVTIPGDVTLSTTADKTAEFKAENVMLENGQKIQVKLEKASNTTSGSEFHAMTSGSNPSTATYTISKDSAPVSVGDVIAEFTNTSAEKPTQTQTITFSKASGNFYAGEHTETLTFVISVKEAPTLADAFENGSTTAVTFKENTYNGTTITFTKNNDQYSYSSSHVAPTVKNFRQSGDKIIIICGFDNDSNAVFAITLDKSDNSYSVSNPDDYFGVHDLQSVVVNGVDIKDTLSKK